MEDVAGLILVQRLLMNRDRAAELWVRPTGIPGREHRPRQPWHEVHLPRVRDGLQSRDLVHPVQGTRLGLPRGAHAPLVRPASRSPTGPKTEPPWANQCPPRGPRRQRHTNWVPLKRSTWTPPCSRAQGLLEVKGAGRQGSFYEWQPLQPIIFKMCLPCPTPQAIFIFS